VIQPTKKNPDALAGAIGADRDKKAVNYPGNGTPPDRLNARSKYCDPAHKAVARMVGYVLTLGTEAAWHGLTIVFLRLTDHERAGLAFATLRSMDKAQARLTFEAAMGCTGAGMPQAPLFNHMDQAMFWADMAEPASLAAYCLASFNAMPRGRQAAFLDHVHGRAAA